MIEAGIARDPGPAREPGSHAVKDFLARNRIPYQWLDIEASADARKLVEDTESGGHRLPIVFFPDGEALIEPDNRTLAEKVGLQTEAKEAFYELLIIGGGPAGLGAAVYGASEGLSTAMIERHSTGGQAGTSSRIENYLGFPKGLTGTDLASRADAQARRLGAEILTAVDAEKVRVEGDYKYVMCSGGEELGCRGLLIATGVTVTELNVPGVADLAGRGIYYGASLTEAAYYKDQHVYVVGGANSAGQGAMEFSRYASQVTILVRGNSMGITMSQYLVDQIADTENIDVMTRTTVEEVSGEEKLETITTRNSATGDTETVPAAALFIFIGAQPHTDLVGDVVERNNAGFILTGSDLLKSNGGRKMWPLKRDPFLLETSVPGIFAAGDVRQGPVRRVASAVGEGAIAISFVHQYLKTV